MTKITFSSIKEHEEYLSKAVYVSDGCITINVEYEYEIELSRCDSLEKILSWVAHLCEKTWMNTEILERFIQIAAQTHGLELPNP